MRRTLGLLAAFGFVTLLSAPAVAGPIADENGKPGMAGSWAAGDDGTAFADGVVDLYPAHWSIAPGDPIELKVRSTTGYDVRVMRLGWYGGAGAREITKVTAQPASPQPYPVADPKFGLAEAKWATTVKIPTDGSWTSGLYVARAEQPSGKAAVTFFTVRDDGHKQPILLVVGTNTHQAYNAWPGPARGGKSLYGFNSSPAHPSESITTLVQAVKVSYDRPFFVGGGSADIANYEYPMLRFLEKNGWDVGYATDLDLHVNPDLAKDRRAVIFSGHEEYTSWEMFDNALAARDSGSSFLFATGDTWSWQVRFEAGSGGPTSTMIGYKESWVHDPEQKIAFKLRTDGKYDEAKPHFAKVTRGWKNLEYDPDLGIDVRRPGILLTGVMSAGVIRDAKGQPMNGSSYPWGDLYVDAPSFWIFDGTGLQQGDKIPNVFGYEVDSTMRGTAEMDPFRPAGQIKFGTIKELSDGAAKGAAGYYQKDLGGGKRVEVVSLGAIFFSWALDDYEAKVAGLGSSASAAAQQMVTNVLKRWTGATPIPPVSAPVGGNGTDPGGYDPEHPASPDGTGATGPGATNAAPVSTSSAHGCSTADVRPMPGDGWAFAAIVAGLGFLIASRIRRRAE